MESPMDADRPLNSRHVLGLGSIRNETPDALKVYMRISIQVKENLYYYNQSQVTS